MLQPNEHEERYRSVLYSNNTNTSTATTSTTLPNMYLRKSRSNSWSSSDEKLSSSLNHRQNSYHRRNNVSKYDENFNYYYDDQDRESPSNNTSLNHYRQSFIIKNTNIDNWNKYFDLLNKSLNLFTFREAASLIDEFINLETYLLNEFKSYEKEEKDMNYQSRKELVEFLNRNLQVFTNFIFDIFFFLI